MANLLNNSMVMEMGNIFLSFSIYTFHAMILFTFLNEKIQSSNNNKSTISHSIRYTYPLKL